MLLTQSRLLRILFSFLSAFMMLLLLLSLPQAVKAKVKVEHDINGLIRSSPLFTATVPMTATASPEEQEGVAIFKPVAPVETVEPVSEEAPTPVSEEATATVSEEEEAEEPVEAEEPIIEAPPAEGESEGARFIPIESPSEPITPTETITEPPTEAITEPIMPTEVVTESLAPIEAPPEVAPENEQLLTTTLSLSDSAVVEQEAIPVVLSPSLNAPQNIACLPFALPTMTEYNGKRVNGPYLRGTTQTVITWQDVSETETSYQVERQIGDEAWEEIANLAPDSTLYTDKGLEPNQLYRYRVRATEGEAVGAYSNVCRKPLSLETVEGHFQLFYRPDACPAISDEVADNRSTCFGNVEMVKQLGATLESARLAIMELGFKDPVPYSPMGVDLFPCDGVGCAVVGGGRAISLTPYFMQPASQAALWAPMHELFHHTQGRYAGLYDSNYEWVTEGQARVIQDQLLGGTRSSNYIEEINTFLANPNQPITEASYQAALFWMYLTQQYSSQEQADKEKDSSFDFLLKFWQTAQANRGQDGIRLINQTLSQQGLDLDFRDLFKNFAVTNYTKGMANVPPQYQYLDLQGSNISAYRAVPLTLNMGLTAKQEITSQSDVVHWGSRYIRIIPDSTVQAITFSGVAENEIYYTLLGLKNGKVMKELNHIGTIFTKSLNNNNLDEMVLIVVGLEQDSRIEFSFSATEPSFLLYKIQRILIDLPHPDQAKQSNADELKMSDVQSILFK